MVPRRIKMKLVRVLFFTFLICSVFPKLSYAGPLEDANTAIKNGDFKKACELLQPLAEEGNEEAQTQLGTNYIYGQGVERDINRGLFLITRAANQGYEAARRIAFKVYLDLVNRGDTPVLFNLGYMCLEGWGGKQDAGACLAWLENAGRLGHEQSLKLLAKTYTDGLYGIAPDDEKAKYWNNLRAAFEAGIDGTWSGMAPVQDGQPIRNTFTFKAEGNTLTGEVAGPRGRRSKRIKNGKIDGNEFSFSYDTYFHYSQGYNSGSVKITFLFSGLFLGDSLELSYSYTGGGRYGIPKYVGETPLTFIAKRHK